MAVMIGNARIAETGGVNGSKGDQTGREVMQQPWSTGGVWTYVIRAKSAAVAKKIAKAMIQACNNNNIGYSQADRLSLYNLAAQNDFNLSKVGRCNCDCSSLVAVCCWAAGIHVAPTMWTGNELALLKATGKFRVYTGITFTKSSAKLHTGDILLRKGHTAIVTVGITPKTAAKEPAKKPAAKKKKSIEDVAKDVYAGKYGNGDTRIKRLKAAGYSAEDIKKIQDEVNRLDIKAVAKRVIAGEFGVNPLRRIRLKRAGYDPDKVQAMVNAIKRAGK